MAAPKAQAALRAKKEAQQKKILIALAPLLLGLLAWQGPKTYKALTGSSAAPAPPPATSTAPTTTGPSPTGTTTAPTSSAGAGTSAADLPDSDPLLAPGAGQLIVFSRFFSKDPFRAKPSSTSSTDGTEGTTGNATASSASLEVNGTAEEVDVGDKFPAGDSTFRLVSAGGQSAEIGLASGSFANGQETIAVSVGETLVLVADPDGTRYAIKLLSVG